MEGLLKLSTAVDVTVLVVQSADHISGLTGATLTITASKAAGAFASITPTVTERSNGWYKLALTTTHTNTLGELCLHITAASADPADLKWQVLTEIDLGAARAEPGQGAPGATISPLAKIDHLYKAFRNKMTQTATETDLYADDGTTVDAKRTTGNDGTTATKGEWVTGP